MTAVPTTAIRLGAERMAKLEALVGPVQREHPSLHITRADVHRMALDLGIQQLREAAK